MPALRVYDEASIEYANILKTIRNGNKRKEYTTRTACLDEMLDFNYLNLAHVSVALVVLIRAGGDALHSARQKGAPALTRRATSKGKQPVAGVEKEFRIARKRNDLKSTVCDLEKGESSSLTASDGATMRTIGSTVKASTNTRDSRGSGAVRSNSSTSVAGTLRLTGKLENA